jgi:diacylglycerol kinase (ATP)
MDRSPPFSGFAGIVASVDVVTQAVCPLRHCRGGGGTSGYQRGPQPPGWNRLQRRPFSRGLIVSTGALRGVRNLIIVNPSASQAPAQLPQLEDWFRQKDGSSVIPAASTEELHEILASKGPDAEKIILGGGDGTLSSALPALLTLQKPVAVLPLGTANDFAKTLGVPRDVLEAARVAVEGRIHRIDVGFVNDMPFLNVASVGVATKIPDEQSESAKRTLRSFSYGLGLVRAIKKVTPFFAALTIDEEQSWTGTLYQISIGNGRYHGGGLTVAEGAAIDDGKLDLYLVSPGRVLQLVASIINLRFGLTRPETLQRLSAVSITLRTDRPRPINVDGEIAATTPATFRVEAEALPVLIPRKLPKDHRGLSAAD